MKALAFAGWLLCVFLILGAARMVWLVFDNPSINWKGRLIFLAWVTLLFAALVLLTETIPAL